MPEYRVPSLPSDSGWDFDDEGLWQFGTFGSGNIRAWTVATETGYRFPTVPLKPRFSVKADISSGDHPSSNTLGTFNPLFPKGNYFGVLATTGPGPINFIDVHPHVETALPHNVSVSVDWIVQWRQSLEDGVYAVPGFLIRAADGSRGTIRRTQARHGDPMAGESSPLVSGGLRNLLCGQFPEGDATWAQPQLLGFVDRLQVLV